LNFNHYAGIDGNELNSSNLDNIIVGSGHKMSRSHVSKEKFRTLNDYNRTVMTDFAIRIDKF